MDIVSNMMGIGHYNPFGRRIVNIPGRRWETYPNLCEYGSFNWEWVIVDGEEVLVCPKCGLDGT